jgi:hypothetical protein
MSATVQRTKGAAEEGGGLRLMPGSVVACGAPGLPAGANATVSTSKQLRNTPRRRRHRVNAF